MTGRGTASRFLGSVLHNGLGRYVQQLQRLSLTFSRDAQTSRGVRDYIETRILDFAKKNPGVVVYLNPKPCRVPKLVTEYLNGAVREEPVTNKNVDQIAELIQTRANQSGLEIIRIRKPYHTDTPSIQGQWHPFTNKPPTLTVKDLQRNNTARALQE
ncbi:39S ribosomal protein L43, mitochondrial [Tachyglossus aculeatus]|uniref:39S ribosomal protein L43, mitochondrial n=1 Tax=Tachyglossus aculeatus TaxID=9261 RepID=UPI0018F5AE38|nr:39S ribosomal protein L43, mitochondrial [Tachyglossus aculeatus]